MFYQRHWITFATTLFCSIGLFLLPSSSVSASYHRRSVLSECQVDLTNVTFTLLLDCVRDKSLLYLDSITATKSIDLLGGGSVKLVRRNGDKNGATTSSQDYSAIDANSSIQEVTNKTWAIQVISKLSHLLRTHVLQIDVNTPNNSADVSRGRRRRQAMMLPMMLFGIVAIGMILVPMGFQFLSMFAGKAVLLSKIALLLSSISGLKRVANSGINYGFYTAHDAPPPPVVPPHPQYNMPPYPRPMWDRSDQPRASNQ